MRAQHRDRIALHVFLQLLLAAIGPAHGVGHGVAHETVRADLEQSRRRFGAGAVYRLGDGGAHFEYILPVYLSARHIVRRATLVDVVDGRCPLERRAHAVPVVLDDIDHRELPEPRHVERFVEGAGVHHRLTHEANDHLIGAAILDGEADPGRNGHVPAHNPVSAEEVGIAIEEVHRAPLPASHAIAATEQFGHDRARRYAAGQRLSVIAVGGDDVVIGAEHRNSTGAARLLPDVEVAEAADTA